MTDERINEILNDVSQHMTAAPIDTERLLLRRYIESDFPDFYAYITEKELCRLCGMDPPESVEEALELFTHRLLAENTRFAIVYKPENKVIGFFSIGVYPCIKADPALADMRGVSLSLGISERYQRRGLMRELVGHAIGYFFEECGLDFVNSGYFVFNEGSRRLQEGAGMKHYMDHVFEHNGELIETREMIVFKSEWNKRTEQ